jgi:hypothetical protein
MFDFLYELNIDCYTEISRVTKKTLKGQKCWIRTLASTAANATMEENLSVQTILLTIQNATRNKRAMRPTEIDGAMMRQFFENTRVG